MPTQFRANVEELENGNGWFIRLINEENNDEVLCENIKEFSTKLNKMTEESDGEINVLWSKNHDVTDEHFYELHQEMAKLKEELEV